MAVDTALNAGRSHTDTALDTSGAIAAVCVTGQLRGVCKPHHVWFLVNRLLAAFAPRADLFVVVPAGDSCQRAAALFPNASELSCVRDSPLSVAERRWVEEGPKMCWGREKYLMQLRLVHRCGELVRQHMRQGASYRWVVRSRADVLWSRFPADEKTLLDSSSDALQLAWWPLLQWQAMADNFAIGRLEHMLHYFDQYDYVLNPRSWPDYDRPDGDVVGKRGVFGHACNYPELILERYLFSKRVPVRYSRSFCFTRMRECGAPIENHCGARQAQQGRNDLAPYLNYVLNGQELLAEQTFPAHFEHDAIFTGKLIEFFHREQSRLARPPKVVDLGAGRGTLMQEFRAWNVVAVGVDTNPILTGVIPELASVKDPALNLSFTVRSMHPRCDFEAVFYKVSPGMDFESADHTGRQKARSPVDQSVDNPMGWIYWLNFLMGRCCQLLSCAGFSTDGRLKYGVLPQSEWVFAPHAWMYVKKDYIPLHGDAAIEVPNAAGPGTLVPVDASSAKPGETMDWIVSLDVAQTLPPARWPGYFASVANLAGQGAILSWGRDASEVTRNQVTAELLQLGLKRDRELEAELRLFAGVGCCGHRSHGLLAFRRLNAPGPQQCEMDWPDFPAQGPGFVHCKEGVTNGCLDARRVWVRRKCGGMFQMGSKFGSKAIFCDTITQEPWEYEECLLVDTPQEEAHVGSSMQAASDPLPKAFGQSAAGIFEELHGKSVEDLFTSVDPLTRPGEPLWSLAPAAELVVAFKLVRLLAMPHGDFIRELRRPWTHQWRYILVARNPTTSQSAASPWLPQLLWHAARRAQGALEMSLRDSGSVGRPLLVAAAAFLGRSPVCGDSLRRTSKAAGLSAWRGRRLMSLAWRRHGTAPLRGLLTAGPALWAALARAASQCHGAMSLPLRVRHGVRAAAGRVALLPAWPASDSRSAEDAGAGAARYFHRLSALPHD